jgi:hypothetical protein
MSWMLLWKIVLLFSMGCFAIMTVVVTIGGAFDIRKLFQRLRDHESD